LIGERGVHPLGRAFEQVAEEGVRMDDFDRERVARFRGEVAQVGCHDRLRVVGGDGGGEHVAVFRRVVHRRLERGNYGRWHFGVIERSPIAAIMRAACAGVAR
jgi:hypothetical protein